MIKKSNKLLSYSSISFALVLFAQTVSMATASWAFLSSPALPKKLKK